MDDESSGLVVFGNRLFSCADQLYRYRSLPTFVIYRFFYLMLALAVVASSFKDSDAPILMDEAGKKLSKLEG